MIAKITDSVKAIIVRIQAQEEKARRAYIDNYLAQSVDRYDLERRERHLLEKGYFR
jgi:hypothetical protein